MNFMNHETQLDLRLAGSKEFGLLLKLILYTSFEVITGFLCPFNLRLGLRLNFTLSYRWLRRLFKQLTSKVRAREPFRLPWPKFLASIGYHLSLPMGLCARSAAIMLCKVVLTFAAESVNEILEWTKKVLTFETGWNASVWQKFQMKATE